VIVLGFDTATPATTVGLRLADGHTLQARDDPRAGEHPGHATRLLEMIAELLGGGGIDWDQLDRIAVGVGPGLFTGLRVGVATARGLAQSLSVPVVGVSSLEALALPATLSRAPRADAEAIWAGLRPAGQPPPAVPPGERDGVVAVIDARRGEVFAATYALAGAGAASELASPRALAPEELDHILGEAQSGGEVGGWRWLGVGDGAVRYRGHLDAAGVAVPADSSPLHLVGAEAICDLGARAAVAAADETIVPDYRRRPDAEVALEGAHALEGPRP
jgi:tRNA threonylcarbamoyl adenosine modification protein YeaZ